MKRSIIIAVVLLAAVSGAAAVLANDFNRAALVNNAGVLTSGEMFGVAIGMSEEEAASILSKRLMRLDTYKDDGTCPLPPGYEKVLLFVDLSWRSGNICAGLVKGKVKTLGWRYNLFQM